MPAKAIIQKLLRAIRLRVGTPILAAVASALALKVDVILPVADLVLPGFLGRQPGTRLVTKTVVDPELIGGVLTTIVVLDFFSARGRAAVTGLSTVFVGIAVPTAILRLDVRPHGQPFAILFLALDNKSSFRVIDAIALRGTRWNRSRGGR